MQEHPADQPVCLENLPVATSYDRFGRLLQLPCHWAIYYNTALLSTIYENMLATGNAEAITRLTKVSPVAWQNVNLFGAFDFSEAEVNVDLSAIAAIVGNPLQWGVVESNLEGEIFD